MNFHRARGKSWLADIATATLVNGIG